MRNNEALLVTLLVVVFVVSCFCAPNSCSIKYGTYTTNVPFVGNMNDTVTTDNKIGRTSYIVQWYQNWGDGSGTWPNVLGFLKIALNFSSAGAPNDHMALLTWQPWGSPFSATNANYPLTSIANGDYDQYIDTWVNGVAALNYSIFIRPFHEMDGDWYPWGQRVNGNTPAQLIAAWRHVHSRFSSRGVTNAKFVWCPNNSNRFNISQESLYPGDAYVDWICLDAYADSPIYPFRATITENCVPRNPYQRLTAMTNKPMMIAEFGVKENSVSTSNFTKGSWFEQMDKDLSMFPRIQALVYFNTDSWRYDTSANSIAGARVAFSGCASQTLSETPSSTPSVTLGSPVTSGTPSGTSGSSVRTPSANSGSPVSTPSVTSSSPVRTPSAGSPVRTPSVTSGSPVTSGTPSGTSGSPVTSGAPSVTSGSPVTSGTPSGTSGSSVGTTSESSDTTSSAGRSTSWFSFV